MKKFILLELTLLFLATTFQSHNPPGWYQIAVPRNDVIVQDMYFTDSLTGCVLNQKNSGDSSYIIKTTNGGTRWTTTYSDSTRLNRIQFVNNNIGYASGSRNGWSAVYKTTNAGDNWALNSYRLLDLGGLEDMFFVNKDTGWVCDDLPSFGGLAKTTNGGLNWFLQVGGVSPTISKIFFINQDTGWAIRGGFTLSKTTNGGTNWTAIYGSGSVLKCVAFLNTNTGWFLGGDSPGIYKTTNGGTNWFSQENPGSFAQSKLFILNSNKVWVGNAIFTMLATSNGGTNWGNQTSPIISNFSVFFTDSLRGYAGTSALIKTDDGGGVITGINPQGEETASDYKLSQNYPNPFNPTTKINYELKITNYVSIKIYDLRGKEIAVLVNEKKNAGEYSINFDAGKYNLSSGIYFYKIDISDERGNLVYNNTKKMILVK